jgi:hypothetical protein
MKIGGDAHWRASSGDEVPRARHGPTAPERRPGPRSGRFGGFAPGVQETLDQFLACIEDGDPTQRHIALVDFLLATTTLAHELRRSGTPLAALQLVAMQAATEAGVGDREPPPGDDEAGRPQPFSLADVKALLIARMEAARRAQMLAGVDTASAHHQGGDGMRFALLPLVVLNAHRPRPPLHRRIAADRTALIRAGLALATQGQTPGPSPAASATLNAISGMAEGGLHDHGARPRDGTAGGITGPINDAPASGQP